MEDREIVNVTVEDMRKVDMYSASDRFESISQKATDDVEKLEAANA